MQIPFLDLKAQYSQISEEINTAIGEVLASCAFAGGRFVTQFEKEFARFCNCRHAVGVGSGTDALWLTLLALGIGPGDQVVTVPNTFLATAEAISYCGAEPVFVDVDEKTYNMDPEKLQDCLQVKPRVRAVIPVHLFGQPADMDPIMNLAKQHGVYVIEDACQAHGAKYKGKPAGSIGDAGCFSFYPGKNLGAYGEAGAVVTNNSELSQKIETLRDHGQWKKYHHKMIGWNARMDGIQGAVLSVKLKYIDKWNEARRRNAGLYNEHLKNLDKIIVPIEACHAQHVYHVYALRSPNRDRLLEYLSDNGVACGIHYPVPVHCQEAYKSLGLEKGSFQTAEKCCSEFLSLPMYPELNGDQIEYVTSQIKALLSRSGDELPLRGRGGGTLHLG